MQQKDTRPRRMHGITPTPFDMPPDRIPVSKTPKSKRPLPITLYACYRLAWAGVSLGLALVPWDDPESKLASYAVAHPAFIVDLLPGFIRMFIPEYSARYWSPGAFLQSLPILFALSAILYAVQGSRLLALSNSWRLGTMLFSGMTVAQIAIGLAVILVSPPSHPISGQALAAIFIIGGLNLLVFCYLAYYPGVKDAFEGQPY